MNAMTVILSVVASILTALLIFVWKSDTQAAKEEPSALEQQNTELKAEILALKGKLEAHNSAVQQRANGIAATSPYGNNTLQANVQYQNDLKQLEKKAILQQQVADRLNVAAAPVSTEQDDLADEEMTSDALGGGDLTDTTTDFNQDSDLGVTDATRTTEMKRINEIRESMKQATVVHIEHSPSGDVIIAKLEDYAYLEAGGLLAVRRHNGIAGKVKITQVKETATRGTIIFVEPASRGINNSDLVVNKGDDLILPLRSDQSLPQ